MAKRLCGPVLSALSLGAPIAAQQHVDTLEGAASDRYGAAIAAAGDSDGDGHGDLIVGVPGAAPRGQSSGAAHVVSGATGLRIHTFLGRNSFDELGWSVAGVGDVDGDGRPDVAAGAPWEDSNGRNAGSLRVFSGKDGSELWHFKGAVPGEIFGISVAAAGDVNADGRPDIVAGGHGGGGTGNDGVARVFSGRDGTKLHEFRGDSAQDRSA